MTFDFNEYDEDDFDDAFFEYARRALEMAGIRTDEKLKQSKPIRHSLLHAIGEQQFLYDAARKMVPKSHAHWELGQFIGAALRPVAWDLAFGAIRNYAQFDYLYRRIWGEECRSYLPMVFAAAVWSPSLTAEFAEALLGTMPDRCDELFLR